jgi:hypothetical protein
MGEGSKIEEKCDRRIRERCGEERSGYIYGRNKCLSCPDPILYLDLMDAGPAQ